MLGFTSVYALNRIIAQDFDEGLEWAKRTMRLPAPSGYWGTAVLVTAYAHLGQLEEASSAVQEALEVKPDLSISYLEKTFPTRHEDGFEAYLSGLRIAGLHEMSKNC